MHSPTVTDSFALCTACKRGGTAAVGHRAGGQVTFALRGGSVGVLGQGGILQINFEEYGDALLVGLNVGSVGGFASAFGGASRGGRHELLCELQAPGQL